MAQGVHIGSVFVLGHRNGGRFIAASAGGQCGECAGNGGSLQNDLREIFLMIKILHDVQSDFPEFVFLSAPSRIQEIPLPVCICLVLTGCAACLLTSSLYKTEEELKRVLRDVSFETDKYHKNYLWILCRSCDQGAALGLIRAPSCGGSVQQAERNFTLYRFLPNQTHQQFHGGLCFAGRSDALSSEGMHEFCIDAVVKPGDGDLLRHLYAVVLQIIHHFRRISQRPGQSPGLDKAIQIVAVHDTAQRNILGEKNMALLRSQSRQSASDAEIFPAVMVCAGITLGGKDGLGVPVVQQILW